MKNKGSGILEFILICFIIALVLLFNAKSLLNTKEKIETISEQNTKDINKLIEKIYQID